MAWVAALIGAAGSIGGGLLSKQKTQRVKGTVNYNISKDPLFAGLASQAGVSIGQQPTIQSLMAGSPLTSLKNQFAGRARPDHFKFYGRAIDDLQAWIDSGLANGMTADQVAAGADAWLKKRTKSANSQDNGLMAGESTLRTIFDPIGLFGSGKRETISRTQLSGERLIRGALRSAGYSNFGDLVRDEINFRTDAMSRVGGLQSDATAAAQGRSDATRRIAGIQSDFVAPTAADIQEQAAIAETAFRGQVTRERADQERALLEQANTMGINPAARLGGLDEWEAQQKLEAQPQGLARALQLLSGQQGLQSTALGSLLSSMESQNQLPLQLAALRSGQSISLGQQSANQALALAGINAQIGQNNAQNLGSGIANAGNLAGQSIFMANNPGLFGLNQTSAPGEPVKNWEWEKWLKGNA
jgi:hypothetical protein